MATTATESKVSAHPLLGECRHIQWTLALNESGDPIQFTEFADKCVQFHGVFGGATVALQGSNDLTAPANWFTLTDPFNVLISATAAGIEQVLNAPMWCRAAVTGGDGTTAITVQLVVRRGRGRS